MYIVILVIPIVIWCVIYLMFGGYSLIIKQPLLEIHLFSAVSLPAINYINLKTTFNCHVWLAEGDMEFPQNGSSFHALESEAAFHPMKMAILFSLRRPRRVFFFFSQVAWKSSMPDDDISWMCGDLTLQVAQKNSGCVSDVVARINVNNGVLN